MATEVISYRTEDGSLFINREAAEAHDDVMHLKGILFKFVEKYCVPNMTIYNLSELLYNEQAALREIYDKHPDRRTK